MRTLVWRALEKFEANITEPSIGCQGSGVRYQATAQKPDTSHLALRTSLPSRANSVRMIQFPEEFSDVEIARRRLALDEFVALQLQIRERRKKFEASAKALPCGGDNRLIKPFLALLRF